MERTDLPRHLRHTQHRIGISIPRKSFGLQKPKHPRYQVRREDGVRLLGSDTEAVGVLRNSRRFRRRGHRERQHQHQIAQRIA